jgi:hypothetical protein
MMNDPHRVDHGSAIPEQFQLLWSDRLCGMQNVAAARLQQDWIKRGRFRKDIRTARRLVPADSSAPYRSVDPARREVAHELSNASTGHD